MLKIMKMKQIQSESIRICIENHNHNLHLCGRRSPLSKYNKICRQHNCEKCPTLYCVNKLEVSNNLDHLARACLKMLINICLYRFKKVVVILYLRLYVTTWVRFGNNKIRLKCNFGVVLFQVF